MQPSIPQSKMARWLLVLGLLAGIVMAASGVLQVGDDAMPADAIARVNDRLILRDAWLRAVAAVSSERRTALTESDKRHILDRLIDEELLAQHGLALGLVEQDRRLRGQLVAQVLQTASASSSSEFSDTELRKFYSQHRDFFTPPARLRIAATRIDANGQRSAMVPPVPNALLPPSELRMYLGPTLTRAVLELQPGEGSAAVAHGSGHAVVEVLQHQAATAPAFEEIREQVRAEMQRRADEAAVRQLLKQLRADNHIVVNVD